MIAEKVTLANMRSHGRRRVLVYCGNSPRCWHSATIDADAWPDDTALVDVARRMVCTECGAIGAEVRPDWGSGVPR